MGGGGCERRNPVLWTGNEFVNRPERTETTSVLSKIALLLPCRGYIDLTSFAKAAAAVDKRDFSVSRMKTKCEIECMRETDRQREKETCDELVVIENKNYKP